MFQTAQTEEQSDFDALDNQTKMEDQFNQIEKYMMKLEEKQRNIRSNFSQQLNKLINTLNFGIPKQRLKIQQLEAESQKHKDLF